MEMKHVEGDKNRELKLYTLSTCIWCKKTKELLREMNVGYDYVDIDLLIGHERDEAMEMLKRFNPRCSFPSLIIDNSLCIVGFDEKKIREALGS